MFIRLITLLLTAFVIVACSSKDTPVRIFDVEDLRLSSLSVDAGEFSSTFAPDDLGPYELTVAKDIDTVEVVLGSVEVEANVVVYRQITGGTADGQTISPGETATVSLDQGENIIVVRVISAADGNVALSYRIAIHRISDNATLRALIVASASLSASGLDYVSSGDGSTDDDVVFDPEVYSYTMAADYGVCGMRFYPIRNDRYSTIYFDGEEIENASNLYVPLTVGDNQFEIEVRSEDLSNTQTYSYEVTRALPTVDELNDDFRFKDVSVASDDLDKPVRVTYNDRQLLATGSTYLVDLGDEFICNADVTVVNVRNDQQSLTISASLETLAEDTEGIDEKLIELWKYNTDDEDYDLESVLEPNVPFTVSLPDSEDSAQWILSLARSSTDDDQPLVYHEIEVLRSANNWVFVKTGAELQSALKAAVGNDHIYVNAVNITAEASLEASGKEGVHFYASASGTEDTPIFISGIGSSVLSGGANDANTVFELAGDYWVVSDLSFATAEKGLVLNAASNNRFNNVNMQTLGSRGLELVNGSHSNTFRNLEITNIGDSASLSGVSGLLIGSSADEWTTAPTPGVYEPANDNNYFANVEVGPSVYGRLIDIKEGVSNTEIFNSSFNSRDVVNDTYALYVSGNNSVISHNVFFNTAANDLSTAVLASVPEAEWLADSWAQGNEYFDNVLDFGNSVDIDAAQTQGDGATLNVVNNLRKDPSGLAVTYSGDGINQGFDQPHFKLVWTSYEEEDSAIVEEEYCLQFEGLDLYRTSNDNLIGTLDMIVADVCESNDAQQWLLERDLDARYLIKNKAHDYEHIYRTSDGIINFKSIEEEISLREHWVLSAGPNLEYYIYNSFSRGFLTVASLTELESYLSSLFGYEVYFDSDKYIVQLADSNSTSLQRFALRRVED